MQRGVVNHVFICSNDKIVAVEAVTITLNDYLYKHNAWDYVVVPIYAVCNQLQWWSGPQSLLIDPSWLVFIEEGVKVNTHAYIKILTENVFF